LIAGTSTGGLIALGLASGLSLSRIKSLYLTQGEVIFHTPLPRWLLYLVNLFVARYDNRRLRDEIAAQFGDQRLGDLQRKVLIAAYDLDGTHGHGRGRWKAKFFHNLIGRDNGPDVPGSDWHALVRDVALYTAAAPVYFPSAGGYVDGGVVAPNPCVAALAQTQDPDYFRPQPGFAVNPQKTRPVANGPEPEHDAPRIPEGVALLSLGTGESPHAIYRARRLNWGYLRWIWPLGTPSAPLLSLMLDGDTHVAAYQCRQLLGDRFRRLQIAFAPHDAIEMDRPDLIPLMQRYAREYAQTPEFHEAVAWLARNWM